jgi:hypothetical protein
MLFSRVHSSGVDFILFVSVQGNVASLNDVEYNVFSILLTEYGSNLNSNVCLCFFDTQPNICDKYSAFSAR